MTSPRILACLGLLSLSTLLYAQMRPTAYTIVEALPGRASQGTKTVYRSGTKVLVEYNRPSKTGLGPATRSLALFDLKTGVSHTWDPAAKPAACTAATFGSQWGDPFEATAAIRTSIAKGDLKPAGAATVIGIPVKIYAGETPQAAIKAWVDEKDGLILRAEIGPPGGSLQAIVDIRKFELGAPPASLFTLPPACASVKPPPIVPAH